MYLEQNLQLNRLVQVDHKGLNKGLNHQNKKHNQKNRLRQLLDRLLNPVVLRLELALPMLLVLLSLGKVPLPRLLVVPGISLETMKTLTLVLYMMDLVLYNMDMTDSSTEESIAKDARVVD